MASAFRRRREYFHDLVLVLKSGHAAVQRREPRLAIFLLRTAAVDLAEARNKYGMSAKVRLLQRSVGRMQNTLVEAFAGAGGAS
jgi:hypothetical protein